MSQSLNGAVFLDQKGELCEVTRRRNESWEVRLSNGFIMRMPDYLLRQRIIETNLKKEREEKMGRGEKIGLNDLVGVEYPGNNGKTYTVVKKDETNWSKRPTWIVEDEAGIELVVLEGYIRRRMKIVRSENRGAHMIRRAIK